MENEKIRWRGILTSKYEELGPASIKLLQLINSSPWHLCKDQIICISPGQKASAEHYLFLLQKYKLVEYCKKRSKKFYRIFKVSNKGKRYLERYERNLSLELLSLGEME